MCHLYLFQNFKNKENLSSEKSSPIFNLFGQIFSYKTDHFHFKQEITSLGNLKSKAHSFLETGNSNNLFGAGGVFCFNREFPSFAILHLSLKKLIGDQSFVENKLAFKSEDDKNLDLRIKLTNFHNIISETIYLGLFSEFDYSRAKLVINIFRFKQDEIEGDFCLNSFLKLKKFEIFCNFGNQFFWFDLLLQKCQQKIT